jgi:FlaA1/EpsC-like NDP-sugar epimerase
MRRYFMTIPEAVELVLQAAFMAGGGEIFELDMGSPVRIVDLAEDFIRLSGRSPGKDVKIEFTGIRPGEKLFEELYCHEETVSPTSHPKVFCLKSAERSGGDPAVQKVLDRLGEVGPTVDPVLAHLVSDLQEIQRVPEASAVSVP